MRTTIFNPYSMPVINKDDRINVDIIYLNIDYVSF